MDSVIELQDLKTMLQLNTADQDGLLNLIIKNTTKALRFKLGLTAGKEFPGELDYIVLEVCVRRYNRLKNEGMASYSQEGESITFKSDDFDDFQDDISAWKEANDVPDASLGKARFVNPFR
ncbi:phage head-tail connector protein [Ligilactobacillus agilis]|uniref:phage head-tail connector protein n=1 Tax=Ligilactobacillus agilis TaxID=1601 RepID=UPI00242DE3EB|nr:phage head-tail connector protein [Ligilactobacillus agilis]